MEITGLKNSDEYKKQLGYLTMTLECEEELYSKIGEDELLALINHLKIGIINYGDSDLVLDNLGSKDDEKLVNARIFYKLIDANDSDIFTSKIKFDNKDFNCCLLKFINYFLETDEIREDAIIKYNLSFLINRIEKINIRTGFEELEEFEFDDKNDSRKNIKIGNKIIIIDENKSKYIDRINITINDLLSFTIDDLNDNQKRLTYYFNLIYLRACIYYFNDYEIMNIIIN